MVSLAGRLGSIPLQAAGGLSKISMTYRGYVLKLSPSGFLNELILHLIYKLVSPGIIAPADCIRLQGRNDAYRL